MEKFLESLTQDFISKGKHKISINEFIKLLKSKDVSAVDVRFEEENSLFTFDFAKNIPINELPSRIREIEKDKTVVLFCSTATRAAIAYAFLSSKGFKNVKILDATLGSMVDALKPSIIYELHQ